MKKIGDIIAKSKVLPAKLPPINHKLLAAAEDISLNPDAAELAFMARQLVQVTMPHSNPKGNPPEWFRTNGNLTLSIRPGYATNPKTGERYCIGYPYGTLPRLILFWLVTEIVQSKSRHIELGENLAEFMRQLGLDPSRGGPRSDAHRLKEQMLRLFRAQISFDQTTDTGQRWLDMQIAPQAEFWWDVKSPEQGSLWKSWIEVGEKFFQAVLASPVPIDIRALKALRQSPLALDLYAWAAHKTFAQTKKGTSQRVTWQQLHGQFGGDYTDLKNFKHKAKAALRKIATLYVGMKIEQTHGGLIIHPGSPAIAEKPDR